MVTFIDLTPAIADWGAEAFGINGSKIVGSIHATVNPPSAGTYAALWSLSGNSIEVLNLNPTDANGNPFSGDLSAGRGFSDDLSQIAGSFSRRAALWSGPDHVYTNLDPSGSASRAYASSGLQQAGEIWMDKYGATRAALWSGPDHVLTDLTPPGATDAFALGLSGLRQVGEAWFPDVGNTGVYGQFDPGGQTGGAWHAVMWEGTSSSCVDLHPGSASDSVATGIDGTQVVGAATVGGVSHAFLWSLTEPKFVDLHPPAASSSRATGTRGGVQVGYAIINRDTHAAYWFGFSDSFLDLHVYLGAGFASSAAYAVYVDGSFAYVVGTAYSQAMSVNAPSIPHAILWRVPLRVPGVDVSHLDYINGNGTIAWARVAAGGKKFALMEASSSKNVADDYFSAANVAGARQSGLKVGVYHLAGNNAWSTALANLDNAPAEEGQFFLDQAGGFMGTGYMPPALDLENSYHLDSTLLSRWVRQWLRYVELHNGGVRPMIYGPKSVVQNLDSDLAVYPLWIASLTQDINADPGDIGPWVNHWMVQQYDWHGRVDGMEAGGAQADLDYFNGSPSDLEALTDLSKNRAPTFLGLSFHAAAFAATDLALDQIVNQGVDPDGDKLLVLSANTPSAAGGTVTLKDLLVTYTPPAGFVGPDTFTVNLGDGRGGRIDATIDVNVHPAGPSTQDNAPAITISASNTTVSFSGIPGRLYEIQRSIDLSTWAIIGTVTATATGKVDYTDTTRLQEGFYRTASKP